MIRSAGLGVLAGVAILAFASGALADNLSYLGSATAGPLGSQQQGITSGPAAYAASGVYGAASASMTLDAPGGVLHSAASATTSGFSVGFSQLDYSFQIHAINGAPTNVAVQLGVTANGYANATGPGGSSYVEFYIGDVYDHVGSSSNLPGPQTYTYSHAPILVGIDYDIDVRMIADSQARGGNQGCVTDCFASAEAWIDPVFTLLGPNASNYVIVGVPGPSASPPTSAAPEPTAWALMIGGFGLVGAAMRRRHALALVT